ncbi:hypothetical protein [Staphylococcus haemolyticus]|uniref:hypothetical protein n=1 Tax=Staphylococcus haemolyticus TaxID=1283 RepID=UPI0034DD01B7
MKNLIAEWLFVLLLGAVVGVYTTYKNRKMIKEKIVEAKFKLEIEKPFSISRYNLDE